VHGDGPYEGATTGHTKTKERRDEEQTRQSAAWSREKHDERSSEAEESQGREKWIVGGLDQANPNPKP
jgi:hypothetical protein